jgi:hypothetical protein
MPIEKERKENKRRGNGWKGKINIATQEGSGPSSVYLLPIEFLCIVQLNITFSTLYVR